MRGLRRGRSAVCRCFEGGRDRGTKGRRARGRDGVNPMYVSIGHRMDLIGTVRLILRCGNGHRVPEPTRLADQLAAQFKNSLSMNAGE
ncbi:MAG: hypothetical protein HOP29_13715 [Phycisphaerales bacterium]|nr:hypothetical protein [Phycisphaerales bacterium]